MTEIECPVCETGFDAIEWEDGECPICENEYSWDEFFTEDWSIACTGPVWEKYKQYD